MQIAITGKHVDLGESLQNHIKDRLNKIIHKYFEHAVDSHVTLEKQGPLIKAYVEVHQGRITIRGTEVGEDGYIASDKALHKIEHNLRRYKERLKDHHMHHELSKEEKAIQYILDTSYDETAELEELEDKKQPAIVAEVAYCIPTLTVGEAVMRMDLGEKPALLFRNKGHGGLNLVYLRQDGNIGWVDPEGNTKIHAPK